MLRREDRLALRPQPAPREPKAKQGAPHLCRPSPRSGCGHEAKHTARVYYRDSSPPMSREPSFGYVRYRNSTRHLALDGPASHHRGINCRHDGNRETKTSAPFTGSHPRTARHQLQSANLRFAQEFEVCIAHSRPPQQPRFQSYLKPLQSPAHAHRPCANVANQRP